MARVAERVERWTVIRNGKGQVLLALPSRPGRVEHPYVLPHGDGLILARNRRDAVFLSPMERADRDDVLAQGQVPVVETDPAGVKLDYVASVVDPPGSGRDDH